jgi:hypothetical protein
VPRPIPTLYTAVILVGEECACGARVHPVTRWYGIEFPIALRDSSTGKIAKCMRCNRGRPVI